MRPSPCDTLERGRIGGVRGEMCGAYQVVCPATGRELFMIASSGAVWSLAGLPGEPWEHVSISTRSGVPRWSEMCWAKGLFWAPDEWAVQYHPAEADYVNTHPGVLHLWRPVGVELPRPPRECV